MLGENDKDATVDRLMQVITAESATILTKNGPVEDELTADKNALAAAKSLHGAHLSYLKNDDLGGVALTVRHQNAILGRLMQIVAKQTVTKWTPACGENRRSVEQGSSREELKCEEKREDEAAADRNSIAAAKFLIGLQKKYRRLKRGGDRERGRGGDRNDYASIVLTIQQQNAIVERLMQILNKTTVLVQTKYGPFEDEATADRNAIRAASVLVSYEGLEIGRPAAPRLREVKIGRLGEGEQEMLLRESVASESLCAGDASGTAGSYASDDGFKIGKPFARCLRDGEIGRSGEGETEMLTCESRRAGDGLEIEESVAGCEPDTTPSDFEFTAEDVVRESLKIVLRDRPDLADKIDKQALIERVRAKLEKTRRDCGESANVVLAAPRQVNRIAEPVRFCLRTDRNGL